MSGTRSCPTTAAVRRPIRTSGSPTPPMWNSSWARPSAKAPIPGAAATVKSPPTTRQTSGSRARRSSTRVSAPSISSTAIVPRRERDTAQRRRLGSRHRGGSDNFAAVNNYVEDSQYGGSVFHQNIQSGGGTHTGNTFNSNDTSGYASCNAINVAGDLAALTVSGNTTTPGADHLHPVMVTSRIRHSGAFPRRRTIARREH